MTTDERTMHIFKLARIASENTFRTSFEAIVTEYQYDPYLFLDDIRAERSRLVKPGLVGWLSNKMRIIGLSILVAVLVIVGLWLFIRPLGTGPQANTTQISGIQTQVADLKQSINIIAMRTAIPPPNTAMIDQRINMLQETITAIQAQPSSVPAAAIVPPAPTAQPVLSIIMIDGIDKPITLNASGIAQGTVITVTLGNQSLLLPDNAIQRFDGKSDSVNVLLSREFLDDLLRGIQSFNNPFQLTLNAKDILSQPVLLNTFKVEVKGVGETGQYLWKELDKRTAPESEAVQTAIKNLSISIHNADQVEILGAVSTADGQLLYKISVVKSQSQPEANGAVGYILREYIDGKDGE